MLRNWQLVIAGVVVGIGVGTVVGTVVSLVLQYPPYTTNPEHSQNYL